MTCKTCRPANGLGSPPRLGAKGPCSAHPNRPSRPGFTRCFPPSYNIIASVSDDPTVKIWDRGTGEFERTLKGHARSVNDVDFDSKGNLLGETFRSCFFLPQTYDVIKSLVLQIRLSKFETLKTTGMDVKTMAGHDHTVSPARFVPGDRFIVSASKDRAIRAFDVSSTFVVRSVSTTEF